MVAINLALNGAAVACADINEEGIDATLTAINELGGDAMSVPVNVGNSAQVRVAMADVYRKKGKISILINCAAIISYTHIEDCTDEEWTKIMQVNIGGYFNCLREIGPFMKKSGGRIVQFFVHRIQWLVFCRAAVYCIEICCYWTDQVHCRILG